MVRGGSVARIRRSGCIPCDGVTLSPILNSAVIFVKKDSIASCKTSCNNTPPPLLDGTNSDDLLVYRPGLSAIYELSVTTPLAQARLCKDDIRELAKKMGLSNWNQPSNSCLATRVPLHQKITKPLLKRIAKAEIFLQDMGVKGCRVKPVVDTATIQVISDEKRQGFAEQQWSEISGYFKKIGFSTVLLEKRGH